MQRKMKNKVHIIQTIFRQRLPSPAVLKFRNMASTSLYRQLKATPRQPGVYLLKNDSGDVLYVGKATSLRHRIQSYFGSTAHLEPKIRNMVTMVKDFEFIVTQSETEALILENTLIKTKRPRYNARLKDDKTYPYLKIGLNEEFPQVYITRRVSNDGARYFGPYANAGSVRKTMNLLKKLFPYRSCTREITGNDPRPCLEYHINRCVAPCIGVATQEEYRKVIDQLVMFMEGKTETVVRDLQSKMKAAASALKFERASLLRDQLQAIKRVTEGQKVISLSGESQDIIAMSRDADEAWIEIFFVRNGKLIGREHFVMRGLENNEPSHVLENFVKQYYDSVSWIPPLLLLQHALEDETLIRQWLKQKAGKHVEIHVPKRGKKRKLVAMVAENAKQGFQQMKAKLVSAADNMESTMEDLQEALHLPRLPRRMECYDISNIHGTTPVGSMVVFENGQPKSSHYRRFKIKSVEGIDDYAMMQEMLRRRFKRLQSASIASNKDPNTENESEHVGIWETVPDMVLIDGGKGHLNAVVEVFLELGIDNVPIASLAKKHEEIFVRDTPEPIIFPRDSALLFLVQRLRDEAHRFAVTYHQKSRNRKGMQSAMDAIPGIGPKRKTMLLRRFKSVRGIKKSSVEELASTPSMTLTLAQKVKDYL